MNTSSKEVNNELGYIQCYKKTKIDPTMSIDLTNVNLHKAYVQKMVPGNVFIRNVEKNLNIPIKQKYFHNFETKFQELRFMDQMGLTHIMPDIWTELETQKYSNICDELKLNINYNFKKYINSKSIYSTIALDGPSACCKSTVIDQFKQKNKISNYIDNLSDTYNFKPSSALTYAIINLRLLTESQNMVLDRSPISNLAYQLCYYIMDCMSKSDNMNYYKYTMTALCKEYIEIHNLTPYLEVLNAFKLNIIVILDSNFERLGFRLFNRGLKTNSSSDMMRSVMDCYLKAQNAAFAYLANELNYYTLDLNFYRLKYSNEGTNIVPDVTTESDILDAINTHLKHIITETLKSGLENNPSLVEFPNVRHLNTFAGTPERLINSLSMLSYSTR